MVIERACDRPRILLCLILCQIRMGKRRSANCSLFFYPTDGTERFGNIPGVEHKNAADPYRGDGHWIPLGCKWHKMEPKLNEHQGNYLAL